MREIIDREILYLFEGLFSKLTTTHNVFLSDAKALCCIFILLYMAMKGYGMLSGDKRLEIMPLLRPFAISMVIIFWTPFINTINFPAQLIQDKSKVLLKDKISLVDDMQIKRRQYLEKIGTKLIEDSADLEQFEKNKDEDWMSEVGLDFSGIFDKIKGYFILITTKSRWVMTEMVEFVVISFFQASSYLIFFLQIVFASLLIIIGPFSFAFSVLPGFQDSYINWIARYVSVSLYSAFGYIVMSLSMSMLQYGLEKELLILRAVTKDEAMFFTYITGSTGGTNFYIVAMIVSALAMLTIPIVSTWVVATNGVGQAVGAFMKGGSKVVGGITKTMV